MKFMRNLKKKALILGVLASLSVCAVGFAAEKGSTATIPTNTTGPDVTVTTPGGQEISEKINSFDVPLISTGTRWKLDAISSSEFESRVTEEVTKNITEESISKIITEDYINGKVIHSTVAGSDYITVTPNPNSKAATDYKVSAKTGEGGLALYSDIKNLEFTTVKQEGESNYLTVSGSKENNQPGAYTISFDDGALEAAMATAATQAAATVAGESTFTTNNGATSVNVQEAAGTVVLDLKVGDTQLPQLTISDIASATELGKLTERVSTNEDAIKDHDDKIEANAEAIANETERAQNAEKELQNAIYAQSANTNAQINKLSNEIDTVGALSAAMAGLHPRFQDGNKGEVAAAVGTYDGKKAMAIGGFYAPNEQVMFSIGAAIANGGGKMANLGVNFALDRSKDRKAAPKDIVYTRKEVDQMLGKQAEQIAALMAEIQALKASK